MIFIRNWIQQWGCVLVLAALTAFMATNILVQVTSSEDYYSLDAITQLSLTAIIIGTVAGTIILGGIILLTRKKMIGSITFLLVGMIYVLAGAFWGKSLETALGFGLAGVGLWYFFSNRYEAVCNRFQGESKWWWLLPAAGAVLWLEWCGILTIYRYLSFYTPSYDFGIFSQMFYYIKETGIPYTTCERSELLSHFAVHMSPTLYIMLPFYWLFPSPITILVLQRLAIASGVIPLWKLAKKYHMVNGIAALLCVVYLLYPAFTGGLFYDFHENKLLAPLILWLLYAMEQRSKIWYWVVVILTLGVKEDAAIYVACISLFMIFSKKGWKKGTASFLLSVIWFFVVVHWLNTYGDGAMMGRYANFVGKEGSVIDLVKNIIKNPAYVVEECFTADKIQFLLWMLVPLAGVMFTTKQLSCYLLFIPLLVINLMSNNEYQSSIFYQYTYGSGVLLIYVTMVVLANWKKSAQLRCLIAMILLSATLFSSILSQKLYYYTAYDEQKNATISSNLDLIPADASVEASTWFVAYLSSREEIYSMKSGVVHEVNAYVFDMRYSEFKEELEVRESELIAQGYKQISKDTEYVVIYYKEDISNNK
jgi:uncharacterized membrane protein